MRNPLYCDKERWSIANVPTMTVWDLATRHGPPPLGGRLAARFKRRPVLLC